MLPAALQYDPNHADAHNNLGVALNEEGRLTEAIECFHQALRCNFGHAEAHNNLGAALMHMGLHAKALEHIGQALRINPAHGTALWNRSLLRLRDGDFEHGWPDYEYRWTQPGFAPRYRDRQRWDGSSLTSKSILVYADQGLGDTIQFVRYLPLVKERGATVIFECQSALIPLLSSGLGADRLIPVGAPVPPFDVEAPLLSLPGIFCTTFATIPAKIPYLRADPSLVEYWRNELEPLGGFKIGIAWQGNPKQPED
ncbi:MAG TPA: tetratricopeptide repeat protein, partial [Gemmataceae bacterium]|nr:tetratricopeptide repeat protein [Gemmataceae bacterium]